MDTTGVALSGDRLRFIHRIPVGRVITFGALVIAAVLVLFPIYWMVITSLKLPRGIYRTPSLWPHVFTFDNYRNLVDDRGFLVSIRNSFLVSSAVTAISVLISSFAAYS